MIRGIRQSDVAQINLLRTKFDDSFFAIYFCDLLTVHRTCLGAGLESCFVRHVEGVY